METVKETQRTGWSSLSLDIFNMLPLVHTALCQAVVFPSENLLTACNSASLLERSAWTPQYSFLQLDQDCVETGPR